MRAVLCHAFGPPESLRLEDVDAPVPGPGEVLVDVHAAALNFPDVLMIEGKYQSQPPFPFAPGGELSGTVAALGEGVTDFQPGEAVFGGIGSGAFVEQVAIAADRLRPKPDAMTFGQAAGIGTTYGTSYYALKQRAALQPGENLLVLGAAGGVGSAAVELGSRMGATVIAAASSAEKLAYAVTRGATHTINYREQDLKRAVRDLTEGRGADVVFDPVGGGLSESAFRSIAWNGRHLVIGFAAGDIPAIPLNLALLKGASIVGVYWGNWLTKEPGAAADIVAELYQLAESGDIDPPISGVFALEDFKDAYASLVDRTAMGKVLLRVGA